MIVAHMTTTTLPARSTSAALSRIALAVAIGAAVATASTAQAATTRCTHGNGTQVETLGVGIVAVPGAVSRDRGAVVDVHVTRRAVDGAGTRDRVAGATVSVRVTAGATTTHTWAHTDIHGVASVRVMPRRETPAGPATLSVEAWSSPETPVGCTTVVEEHGLAEHGTRVVR